MEANELAFLPGDTVLTTYGCGVIVHYNSENGFFKIRLWRVPGRSLASSALGSLQRSAIRKHIPVAPGMIARLKQNTPNVDPLSTDSVVATTSTLSNDVLVMGYNGVEDVVWISRLPDSHSTNTNDVESPIHRSSILVHSPVWEGNGPTDHRRECLFFEKVSWDSLESTVPTTARFYPILEILMQRAERTAAVARNALRTARAVQTVHRSDALIQNALQQFTASTAGGTDTTTSADRIICGSDGVSQPPLKELSQLVHDVKPVANQAMKEVWTVLKDEKVTDLLVSCKERLEQLIQSSDVTESTRKALAKSGIRFISEQESFSLNSLQASRQSALKGVEALLQQLDVAPTDLDNARTEVAKVFTDVYDSLSKATGSDRGLNALFESISAETKAWHEATGSIMKTRSASLFVEGATRLQNRAAMILHEVDWQWAGEIGSKLTKSFSEGDAAIARIKSLELGEAMKSRLIQAIEVRSESLGGLDGIIAGTLATIEKHSNSSGEGLQSLLYTLHQNSTNVTRDAHESLIAVLSTQSPYRDAALMRLERVMAALGGHLSENLSPEEIAAVASGEGGTSNIFGPIARRAMQQIDEQLDAVEVHIRDDNVLEIIKRIRKIMSGEMTVAAVMDEFIGVLNDDKFVAAGESLMLHSETVLDAIEGVSESKVVNDAFQLAEKVGITKDYMMKEIEKLDVDKLIDEAGSAVTDEKARRKIVSSALDAALDFALRIIPSMPVPPFEGVKDGLIYEISNLSLEGFKVQKEDIHIELAGLRATTKQKPKNGNVEIVDADDNNKSFASIQVEEVKSEIKSTELLVIDIKRISAVLEDIVFGFEQTYMPYLKGGGKANAKMSDGCIRLQFELRRRRKEDKDEWEPVLCLHDRTCSISEVELNLHGEGKVTWMLNKLAQIFRGPLRDYVVRSIIHVLTSKSGWILGRLNNVLSPYWDLILRTSKLELGDLLEANENVVVDEDDNSENIIELVWREHLPLGMNLLTNDRSGLLKVVEFPRGSQARAVCERRHLDPKSFEGAVVLAVNGTEYELASELFDALRDPGRPKTVRFQLSPADEAEKLRHYVEKTNNQATEGRTFVRKKQNFELRTVEFIDPGELGIEFTPSADCFSLVVTSLIEREDGTLLAAEKSGKVAPGDMLTHVNGVKVVGTESNSASTAVKLLEQSAGIRPLTLGFSSPYLYRVDVLKEEASQGSDAGGGPTELILTEIQRQKGPRRIAISGFNQVSGMAENSGILIGDYLVFVNGSPVGAGCRWLGVTPVFGLDEVYNMIRDRSAYPMGLTFARRKKKASSSWETSLITEDLLRDHEAETFCVTTDSQELLGCLFDQAPSGDVIVRDFYGVPGILQRCLSNKLGPSMPSLLPLSIESLNNQCVPSYASAEIVMNALKRGWKTQYELSFLLCNDELKEWIDEIT